MVYVSVRAEPFQMARSASAITLRSSSASPRLPCALCPGRTSNFAPTCSSPETTVAIAVPFSRVSRFLNSSYSSPIALLLRSHSALVAENLPIQAFDKHADGPPTSQADLLDILLFGNAKLQHLRLARFDDLQRRGNYRRLYAATAHRAGQFAMLINCQLCPRLARC